MVGSHGAAGAPPSPSDGLRLSASPAYIRGPPFLQLPLLTLGSLGTQIVWSVEMAYGTPYLLELGLSKAAMAAVYTAGPISGLVVQPVIGILADKSTHRWGRRRPYLIASCLGCTLFVLLLGYARVVADVFQLPSAVLPLTVLSIWGLDFSVNAVMAIDRALIFDILPAEKQADGNAWLARLCNIGSILGFFVGDVDLPASFPFSWMPTWGSTKGMTASEPQVRCLSLLTAVFMLCTHAAVAWAAVEQRLERIPGYSPHSTSLNIKPLQIVVRTSREFFKTASSLSTPIREVLKIQTLSWICWFPLLFYTTEWISSVAVASYLEDLTGKPSSQHPDMKKLKAQGTRAGSHALFLQSIVSFACSIVLPLMLPSPDGKAALRTPSQTDSIPGGGRGHVYSAPRWLPSFAQQFLELVVYRRFMSTGITKPSYLVSCIGNGIHLTTLWTCAHFTVALITWLMWPASTSNSVGAATLLVALAGYSWAVTSWGPFTLLGILIRSGLDNGPDGRNYESLPLRDSCGSGDDVEDQRQNRDETPRSVPPRGGSDHSRRSSHPMSRSEEEEEEDEEASLFFDPTLAPLTPPMAAAINGALPAAASSADAGSRQAGTILGLHNIAIVIPQLLVSILASVIFAIFDKRSNSSNSGASSSTTKGTGMSQNDAIGLVFRLGGIASVAAGLYTIRLSRQWGGLLAGASGDGRAGGGEAVAEGVNVRDQRRRTISGSRTG